MGADLKFLASSVSQCNMVAVDKRAWQGFIDLSRQLGCEMSRTMDICPEILLGSPEAGRPKLMPWKQFTARGHLRWGTCRQEVLPGGVVLKPAAVQRKYGAGAMTETFLCA